ncbi:MAG TPA: hypothetical protein VIJ27_07560, partial [Mucilaginibacter sp.]
MKTYIKPLLIIIVTFVLSSCNKDVKTLTRTVTVIRRSEPLDTNEIIYDENGKGLRYYQSQKLINTGEYTIVFRVTPGGSATRKQLVKLSPAQQIAAFERVKPFLSI